MKLEKGEIIEPKKADEKPIYTNDFTVDEKNRTVLLTEAGMTKAEEFFGVGNLYSLENAKLSHHLDQALKANYLFEKDVDYVVKDNEGKYELEDERDFPLDLISETYIEDRAMIETLNQLAISIRGE